MARGGGLPDLHPQLRRRERRRRRRPGRHPEPAAATWPTSASTRVWITPFYPSPMADHGYDVADPRDVEPVFGDLAEFDALLAEAHRLGLRVTVDLVPNHTSDQHEWFRAALAVGRRARRSGRATCSATAGARTATSRRTTGRRSSAARPGPGCPTASGTCTCSRRSSPTWTSPTPRCSPTSRRRCGSGWTAASTASGSTSPTAWPSPTGCRTWCRWTTPACSPTTAPATSGSTRTACTTCTAGSGTVLDELPRARWPSARSGCPTTPAWRGTCGRTSCSSPSTSSC